MLKCDSIRNASVRSFRTRRDLPSPLSSSHDLEFSAASARINSTSARFDSESARIDSVFSFCFRSAISAFSVSYLEFSAAAFARTSAVFSAASIFDSDAAFDSNAVFSFSDFACNADSNSSIFDFDNADAVRIFDFDSAVFSFSDLACNADLYSSILDFSNAVFDTPCSIKNSRLFAFFLLHIPRYTARDTSICQIWHTRLQNQCPAICPTSAIRFDAMRCADAGAVVM